MDFMKQATGIYLDEHTLKAIDNLRGSIPRTQVFESLINRALEKDVVGGPDEL
jgi:hypothetical protein